MEANIDHRVSNLQPRVTDRVVRGREVIDVEIEALRQVRNALDDAFHRAVDHLLDALLGGGKIVVCGIGKNFHIAQKLAATFTSTGSPAVTLHPSEAMHGDLGILDEKDAVLALSYTGGSEELLGLLPMLRRRGRSIVAITGATQGPLADASDVVLSAAVPREACPFNMAPTASTTATLALGDALAMVLLEARGFDEEDYAKLHPGGAIGRALLLRVRDVMRTGDRLATVAAGATIRDALVSITRCKAGAVAITDGDGRLQGIFTDGDLRRLLTAGEPFTEQRIDDVMTRGPITIREDDLAVDILRQFEEHNINDLIVLDHDARVVGHVDIQDLPKFKIL